MLYTIPKCTYHFAYPMHPARQGMRVCGLENIRGMCIMASSSSGFDCPDISRRYM